MEATYGRAFRRLPHGKLSVMNDTTLDEYDRETARIKVMQRKPQTLLQVLTFGALTAVTS